MKLSIVSTLYLSAATIGEFHRRMTEAARALTADYEIVLVNDGSPDDSLAVARELLEVDERLVIVDLSRNFGHHRALMTGLRHASGDLVFLIDSDLEEPPELLLRFAKELEALPDVDVIYGVQLSRKGRWFERVSGEMYYTIFNALSPIKISKNVSVVRLMTRRYVDSLLRHHEQELFFAGLAALTGYKQIPLTFVKSDKGSTSYNLARKLDLVANSIASFSNRPLLYIFYLGLLITMACGVLVAFYLVRYTLGGIGVSGWTSVIVSLWSLGGMILLALGVIGIYLAKMFSEVKNRPYTVIREVYRRE